MIEAKPDILGADPGVRLWSILSQRQLPEILVLDGSATDIVESQGMKITPHSAASIWHARNYPPFLRDSVRS